MKLGSFLSRLVAALSLCVLTITVLNEFNPMMQFLTSTPSKILIAAFCIAAFILSVKHLNGD